MRHAELQALAKQASVPFTTLWKIRSGETRNPGIDTVRKLLANLPLQMTGSGSFPSNPTQETSHAAS
jgi:predicted transcriptional regulator